MTHHFTIDNSSDEAQALMAYLRTLDFVQEENSDFVLTDAHREILIERRKNHLSGKSKSYSVDDVMDSLGNS